MRFYSYYIQSNFIEITLRHGCSPVNLLHYFRAPFYKNTSECLLLPFDPGANVAERSGSKLIFIALYNNSKIVFDIINSVFEIICRPIKNPLVPGA